LDTEEMFVMNLRKTENKRQENKREAMSIKINRKTFFNANSFIRGDAMLQEIGGVKVEQSVDDLEVYRLGIIDFLTDYNTAKKLETKFNNMRYGKDK
jgi:hypothetical protein